MDKDILPATDTLPARVTPAVAGEQLGITRRSVLNWIADGRITGLRVGGRWYIPVTALHEIKRQVIAT